MKKLIWTLFVLMFGYSAYCQVDSLQVPVYNEITNGLNAFFSYINWLYIIVYVLVAWLVSSTIDSDHEKTLFFNKLRNYKFLVSLGLAIKIGILFYWQFRYTTREEAFPLILSGLIGMVIYHFGIDNLLRKLSAKYPLLNFLFKQEKNGI